MADPVAKSPVLQLKSVMREFGSKRKTRVLHGIDLVIQHGEFTALIGPSGSGKSTMLNIMGLLDRPSSGEVLLGGQPMTHLDDDALTRSRSRTLGFVFQFHHLLPAFTALENVMIPAWGDRGTADAALRERAEKLLHGVGLSERIHNRASDLSGGEAQRVAIARALCQNPPLILADEPTGNLDTQTADGIFTLLRRLNREHSTTFLIVTHDERLAGRCDRIIRLVDGRIVQDLRRADPAARGSDPDAPSLFQPLPPP